MSTPNLIRPMTLEDYGNAVEHNLRTIHMALPASPAEGHPRGTHVCKVCMDPATLNREIWPCPTVRITRRLRRAVERSTR